MIHMDNVSKAYSTGNPAVNEINLHIEKGEFVFIIGSSGAGKTTLFKLILKELEPSSGTITVAGQELNSMKRKQIPKFRRNIGVVFQDFRLLKDRSIYENIAFAQRVVETSSRRIRREVPQALSAVGLAERYRAYPSELSGGEQQRVALARALVNKPQLIMADEPTGNLDAQNAWEIMKMLEEINEQGTTVLVVTHNREIVDAMKKRVITLEDGRIVSDEKEGGYEHEA